MKPELQSKALAELDGWSQENQIYGIPLPYLTSYDAIIPLIQKYWDICCESSVRTRFEVCSTPAQLCEALLRATGKWIE